MAYRTNALASRASLADVHCTSMSLFALGMLGMGVRRMRQRRSASDRVIGQAPLTTAR